MAFTNDPLLPLPIPKAASPSEVAAGTSASTFVSPLSLLAYLTSDFSVRLRRVPESERMDILLGDGEPLWTIDAHQLWVGDGATLGGILVSGGGVDLPTTDLEGGTVLNLNTKYYDTFAADRTLTFNGTPVDGDRVFLNLSVTDSGGIDLQFPLSYRLGDTLQSSLLTIPEGEHELCWVRVNEKWMLSDSTPDPSVQEQIDTKANKLLEFNNQSVSSYTLVLDDAFKMVSCSHAIGTDLTIPNHTSVPMDVGTSVLVVSESVGVVNLIADTGVTLISRDNALQLSGPYAVAVLIKKAANTWLVTGDVIVGA